jgi:hypothetical protein
MVESESDRYPFWTLMEFPVSRRKRRDVSEMTRVADMTAELVILKFRNFEIFGYLLRERVEKDAIVIRNM